MTLRLAFMGSPDFAVPTLEAIRVVVAAVSPKPVNVLSGPGDGLVPHAVLAAAGVTQLTPMSCPASSLPSDFVSAITAAFEAE